MEFDGINFGTNFISVNERWTVMTVGLIMFGRKIIRDYRLENEATLLFDN